MNEAEPLESRRGQLIIYATRGFDNYTFAMAIESRRQIERAYVGQVVPTSRVTIAMDTRADFERAFGAIEPQVVALLTGLNLPHLLRDRWRVEVRDSESDRVLWTPPLLAA
jgi:hypothetical protein